MKGEIARLRTQLAQVQAQLVATRDENTRLRQGNAPAEEPVEEQLAAPADDYGPGGQEVNDWNHYDGDPEDDPEEQGAEDQDPLLTRVQHLEQCVQQFEQQLHQAIDANMDTLRYHFNQRILPQIRQELASHILQHNNDDDDYQHQDVQSAHEAQPEPQPEPEDHIDGWTSDEQEQAPEQAQPVFVTPNVVSQEDPQLAIREDTSDESSDESDNDLLLGKRAMGQTGRPEKRSKTQPEPDVVNLVSDSESDSES
tara:strand:+ start:640 stop:1401 length:762 start_codon:yes stop_codon:yes gene_type:complete